MQKKKKKKKKRTMWQRTGHLHIYPYVCQTENIIQRSIANAYFHMSPQCSVSTVIRLPHQSQLKNRLSLLGIYISSNTSDHILHLYRQCHRTPFRKHVFNHIVESVTDFDQCLDSLLVQFFVENGSLDDAYDLICCLNDVSILVWNCLISAYAEKGRPDEALHVFQKMQERGICPDKITFLNAMSSCNSPLHLLEGKVLHDSIIFSGCETDVMVGTTLVTMYSRCGSLHDASKVFDNIRNSNVVSWTAMIAAYARYGQDTEAFQYFDRMKQEAVIPNRVTFLCFLESCFRERSLEKGKQLHSSSIAMKLDSDVNLLTAFLNMYDRCGSLEHVKHIFVTSPNPDVVLWNATMAAFIHHKEIDKALHMFDAMQQEGVIPNVITYATSISACVVDSSLRNSKRMHVRIVCGGLEDDIIVATSLINMYGKNGNLKIASQLFDHLSDRNVVSWNALMAGYAQLGQASVVLDLFRRMRNEVMPDPVTFLILLTSCSHAGLMEEGEKLFDDMHDVYHLDPTLKHYSCMVDLFGRAGHFDKAQMLLDKMPYSDHLPLFLSVLGACRKWLNVKLGRWAFEQSIKLDEKCVVAYVCMENIYAAAGMQEKAREIEAWKVKNNAWSVPLSTDANMNVYSFEVAIENHMYKLHTNDKL
mgnify:CR=1 FL=1